MNQPLNFVAHDLDSMMMPTQPMLPGPGMGTGIGGPGMYSSTPGFPPGGVGGVGGFGTGYRGF